MPDIESTNAELSLVVQGLGLEYALHKSAGCPFSISVVLDPPFYQRQENMHLEILCRQFTTTSWEAVGVLALLNDRYSPVLMICSSRLSSSGAKVWTLEEDRICLRNCNTSPGDHDMQKKVRQLRGSLNPLGDV
jgi:hypothetical protein